MPGRKRIRPVSIEIRSHPTSAEHDIGIVTDKEQNCWYITCTKEGQLTEKAVEQAWRDERNSFLPYTGA